MFLLLLLLLFFFWGGGGWTQALAVCYQNGTFILGTTSIPFSIPSTNEKFVGKFSPKVPCKRFALHVTCF